MSQFEEYKKSLENYLINIDYLYSGDVISSQEKSLVTKIQKLNFAPEVVIKALKDIYDHSIKNLISKSPEIVVNRQDFVDVRDLYTRLGFSPTSLFLSKNSLSFQNHSIQSSKQKIKSEFIPEYFQMQYKMGGSGNTVNCYYSPVIDDSLDDCHIYFVDKGIQSFVWILQNMTYSINRGFSSNEHLIKYPIYECDFQSIRIRVVDTQKIREKKISQILDL